MQNDDLINIVMSEQQITISRYHERRYSIAYYTNL